MNNNELLKSIEQARSEYIQQLIKAATSSYSSASQQVAASRCLEAIYRDLSSEEEPEEFVENDSIKVIKIGG